MDGIRDVDGHVLTCQVALYHTKGEHGVIMEVMVMDGGSSSVVGVNSGGVGLLMVVVW